MRELAGKLLARLPLQFRILYRQFLLRVVDLEALSIEADIPRFLGQFAGILIMFSLVHAAALDVFFLKMPWYFEQYLITTEMLVAGLITVICWDSTFPDRRDVMVLSPLPLGTRTILFAKVAASATLLGLAVVTLNCASGIMCPSLLATQLGSGWRFFQSFAAYWFTMVAASLFIYCAVLTVQGLIALLLPRRLFLRLSALLQLGAFGLFLGAYFLQPSFETPATFAAPENQWLLASSPSFWFFGLFNQLNGSLPTNLAWLALRAWIGLAVVIFGAVTSLLLCYLRTMKKTVEEPDIVPGAHGWHWTPHFGDALETAIVLFSIRSLTRSRHHRVAFAFYLSLVLALALSSVKVSLSAATFRPVTADFLIATFLMMSLAVGGLRSVFSLPISLNANWVLRTTQLCPSQKYIAATRKSLLILAVVPVWMLSAALMLPMRPLLQVAGHLVVLALLGSILVDLSLIGFYKVPFTCSYLPGKVNIQFVLWGSFFVFAILAIPSVGYEMGALHDSLQFAWMTIFLGAAAVGLWVFNRHRAKSAVIYFEELPPEIITTLGLTQPLSSAGEPKQGPSVL
ncbi:MAG TPA: hypothetical protein VMU57_05650 [Edaphobacter sp.]|uniref:hypothetical protein n=1 Tax=Edaphobacter sp. TaxID=1934404 RepID=UPI002C08FACA|nr:hypothetical protein [Edaphobacter sp.]HUZ94380.1 hypothetical protein [Edaphobacter sp.]